MAALDRHDRDVTLRSLFGLFPLSLYERKRPIILVALESGDPHLLTDRSDPLWLGFILSEPEPAIFSEHAEEVLKRKKEKVN